MDKKLDDYLDSKVRNVSSGVGIERIFTLKIIEAFNKYEYAQFEEEIKRRTRTKILHEIMKLVAQEIVESGDVSLEISGSVLRGRIFDKGRALMIVDGVQLRKIKFALSGDRREV